MRVDRRRSAPPSARRSAVSVSSASSGIFASDGPIFTRCTNGGRSAAEDAQPGHRHVVTERIRHEIDLVAERGQRADAVELAERRPARLEERLGRDHQNAHVSGDFRIKSLLPDVTFLLMTPPPAERRAARRYGLSGASSLPSASSSWWFLLSRIDVGQPVGHCAPGVDSPGSLSRMAIYVVNVLISVWRWHMLLGAQRHRRAAAGPCSVRSWLRRYFSNFLPSNIGGDVMRISDTARGRRIQDAGRRLVVL